LVLAHDPEEDAKRIFEKGLEELDGGRLEGAIDGFKRAWEQVPTNLKYLLTLASTSQITVTLQLR
jgi:outer membrane protein assembly factor BamD (BamD/ComL family)